MVYQRTWLTPPMLEDFAQQACERLIECTGEPDHVHLLLELPVPAVLAEFVNALKTATSRRLPSAFAAPLETFYAKSVLWLRSYCVLSCGGAPLAVIQQ